MKISVVIPVYNAENYIRKCLDSVIYQTYTDWEVIAIDDGSKDSSYNILIEYANKDSRIKVVKQKNSGAGSARNKGILNATGKYIVFLDSDDYINESYFQEIYDIASQNHSDVIFVDVLQEKVNGELIKYERMSKYKGKSKDTIIRHQMTGKLPWGGVRKAVKASIIKTNNIMYSDDIVGEEALFSFQVINNSEVIDFISNPHYHYINYPNSQSKKGDEDPWGGVCKNIEKYLIDNDLLDKYKYTINSLALTSCMISIYRICQKNDLKKSIYLGKYAINNFKLNYGYEIDIDSLEKRVILMLFLFRFNLVWIIVLIAKLKFKFESIKNK